MDSRLVLQGILFVLFTGIGWEDLPQELGFGSSDDLLAPVAGLAGRRSVRADASADARPLPRRRTDRLRPGHGRRLRRPGEKGGAATGPSPVDRAKTGSKHHILTCGNGFPLAVTLSAANINDHLMLPELLDRVQPLRGRPGRPRHRITTLIADKGYDYPRVYDELRQRRITGYIPRRGTRDKVTAGRWIVEQTLALLTNSAAWPSDGNAAPTSITGFSTSLPHSSVGEDSAIKPDRHPRSVDVKQRSSI